VDLHGDDFSPTAPGSVTALAGMNGRVREFRAQAALGQSRHVTSIVVATDCKAVVATLVSDREITKAVEQAARATLAEAPFQQWVSAQ
jgi:hypothetical protein